MAYPGSRHTACRLCRDRKVRCDGEVPTCGRCAKAREVCVYVPSSNPTKADLVETVETVQDRLNKAEASLAAIHSQQARNMRTMPDPIFSSIGLPADGLTMPQFLDDPVPMSAEATTVFDWNNMPTMNSTFSPDIASHSRRTSSGPLVFTSLAKHKGSMDMAQSSNNSGDMSSSSSHNGRSSNSSPDSLPSLMDVRRWISTPGAEASTGSQTDGTDTADAAVLASFRDFMVTSLSSQAKIAGIAAALADYISWTRQRERGGDLVFGDVLEMFEARAREITGLAEMDGQKAYQQVEATLGQLAAHEQTWRSMDVDVAQKRRRLKMFFDKTYDIHTPLSDQQS